MRPLRLFVLAGEPSGDALGADLLSRLQSKHEVQATGVGGPAMLAAGMEPIFPMTDLSVMGFVDVFSALPRLLERVRRTADYILANKPDVVVLIDYQEFSAMVAKRLRQGGFEGAVLLYVAPSVWAWRPERARKLEPLMHEILSVLPFEPRVFEELGGPATSYVGHPAVERVLTQQDRDPRSDVLLLLPGSRRGELRRHLPIFSEVARHSIENGVSRILMPTLPHLVEYLTDETVGWKAPVEILSEGDEREEAWRIAGCAVACAGTVTLELALAGIPHVLTYVPDWFQRRAYEKAGRPMIGLPNIILGTEVVPEVDVQATGVEGLINRAIELLNEGPIRTAQTSAFMTLRDKMDAGESGHEKKDAAERVLFHFNQQIDRA